MAFLVWELVRLQEPLHRRRREDGLRLAHQVRHCLFVTLCRQDCESRWRHTSIYRYIRIARTRACTRTVYTPGEQGRELQFATSIYPFEFDFCTVTAIRAHVIDIGGTCMYVYSCNQLVPKGRVLLGELNHTCHTCTSFLCTK